MNAYKFCILCLSLLMMQMSARSQQGVLKFNANYSVGIPTGNFKNLVSDVSPRGWSGALLYGVTDDLSIGLEVGFQDFYQKFGRQVYHENGSDISAVITNSVQTMPVFIKGKYQLQQSGVIQPFAALGVGGNFIVYNKYYGQFSNGHSRFAFAAQPEVGINVPFGREKRTGFHIAAAYNLMPFTHDDADGLHHAVLKAGVSVPLR